MSWFLFGGLLLLLLALDLGVFHKQATVPKPKESLLWTLVWVTIAISFSGFIYWSYASGFAQNTNQLTPGLAVAKYLTAYLLELSLSMDNVFVIAIILQYFKIPSAYQHRVLFWGILGAVVFRGLMIWLGVALIHTFEWVNYLFGLILLFSAYKMFNTKHEHEKLKENSVIRMIRRFFPVTKGLHGNHFAIKRGRIWALTPLFLALFTIELTDVMFAIDSVPAALSITTDPYLVYTSNIFAILGLRSMYFVLAILLSKFRYLQPMLVFILVFVGIKMILSLHFHLPEWLSLGVVLGSLTLGILLSLNATQKDKMNE